MTAVPGLGKYFDKRRNRSMTAEPGPGKYFDKHRNRSGTTAFAVYGHFDKLNDRTGIAQLLQAIKVPRCFFLVLFSGVLFRHAVLLFFE